MRIEDVFGEVIYSYTRAQAIEDGVLVDVTETAKEAGFKIPVALTRAVWAECVEVPPGVVGQDERGRLWDILFVAAATSRRTKGQEASIVLCVRKAEGLRQVMLKGVCSPGDDGAPVVTIMFPHED